MFSKYLSSSIAIILFSFNVSPSKLLQAQSVAVDDNYQILEDSELKTGTGPILEVSFDEEIAPGFIEDDWQILDRLENENGDKPIDHLRL